MLITTSLIQSLAFFLTLVGGILLPGLLITSFLRLRVSLTLLESFLYSLAFGIGFVDALYLILNSLHLPLTQILISWVYACFLILGGGIWWWCKKRSGISPFPPLITTKKAFWLALLIFGFALFVKTWYLADTVLPTATDLGHHVYWSKLIADEHVLPAYEKQDVVTLPDGTYALSDPEPISDFIIGEHIPFAFLQTMTGIAFTTALPIAFLLCINLASLLTLAVLSWRLLQSHETTSSLLKSEYAFVLALFLFGPLFTLASPEAKFVSGGVVGNILGNFFIPLTLLTLFRSLREKSPLLLTTGFVLVTITAYTHHLSTFIFLYIALGFLIVSILFFNKKLWRHWRTWLTLLKHPAPWVFLVLLSAFILWVGLPTYLQNNAVTTAVGAPTKTTRTGLTLEQVSTSNGVFRTGAAFFALLLIVWSARLRNSYAGVLVFAWTAILLVATLFPKFLFIDIPSNRISYYVSFPIGVATVLSVYWLIERFIEQTPDLPLLKRPFTWLVSILLFTTLVAQGTADNEDTLPAHKDGAVVAQTFQAAQYLADHTQTNDLILKDHNFIAASDTWMKIFFNRGYAYPLSRSNFNRYETPGREQCTLAMISTPNTAFGKQCFDDLSVRYLVVNPRYDFAQFAKTNQFSLIYTSPGVAVFQRNP